MANLIKKSSVIKQVDAKTVWNNSETNKIEESYMSPFIEEHLEDISDIIGYELCLVDTEVFIGAFRADIICRDINTDSIIVIENQLNDSDHDHLGKAFTYLANVDAKVIVWICENVRDEHKKAVIKLNELTPDDYNFYLLELKFEQYGDNEPYYYFNKVVIPTINDKLASSYRYSRPENIALIRYFENLVAIVKKDLKKAAIAKNKPYCKLNKVGPVYFGVGSGIRSLDSITFELSLPENSQNEIIEKTDNFVKEINKKYNYSFKHVLGKRNERIHKWLYKIDNQIDSDKDLNSVIGICKVINKELMAFFKK